MQRLSPRLNSGPRHAETGADQDGRKGPVSGGKAPVAPVAEPNRPGADLERTAHDPHTRTDSTAHAARALLCDFDGHEWTDAGGGMLVCGWCEAERWAAA